MSTFVTRFGSLDQYEKGHIEIINDNPKNYVFSNVFEVAGKSKPYEKVAVAKNLEYVIEAIRAESIRRANERRGEKEKIKRAEERAIRKAGRELDARRAEEAKAEVKRTPIRQTADVEAAIARAKLDARERLAARAEACDAIRQAKIEHYQFRA